MIPDNTAFKDLLYPSIETVFFKTQEYPRSRYYFYYENKAYHLFWHFDHELWFIIRKEDFDKIKHNRRLSYSYNEPMQVYFSYNEIELYKIEGSREFKEKMIPEMKNLVIQPVTSTIRIGNWF